MTYHNYEWTAFTEADLLAQLKGGNGDHNIGRGDSFTMPGSASVTMSTWDNDNTLSGNDYWNEGRSDDRHGQNAKVDGQSTGGKVFAESYHVLHGSDGQTYYMIEIEIEGHDAPGAGDDYFSFYGAVPPAGVELTVNGSYNISGHWVDFAYIGAGSDTAPANTAPKFTNDPADGIVYIDENTSFVINLDASDADGDSVTYEITGGRDASFFEIDAHTGELSFKNAQDFENPQSGGHSNTYDVTVTVSDGNGGTTTKAMWIKIKDVNETVNTAPTFDNLPSNGVICIDENTTFVVDVNASDVDGDALTYSITGGVDAGKFEINAHTGELNFVSSPDFENPNSAANGGDNTYDVTVTVDDGNGGTFTKPLWIKVKDVDEATGTGGECIVIEAEDMHLNGYQVEHNAGASGGEIIKGHLNCWNSASTTFEGMGGEYDLKLTMLDENDGNSYVYVYVNGHDVSGLIRLDQDNGGAGGGNTFNGREITIEGLNLQAGDEIKIWGYGEGGEYVRLDKIELCKEGEPVVEDASLGGTYFMDANNNGVQDAGDMAIAGATVQLFKDGVFVGSETTDANGDYLFDGLDAGDGYSVRFVDTGEGKTFVAGNVGNDDTIDSDVVSVGSAGNGNTGAISLAAGEDKRNVDAGIEDAGTASLSGRLTLDDDKDDTEFNTVGADEFDDGLVGKTVELLDENGAVVATTTTGADGEYSFTGLAAGTYSVRFPDVMGFVFADQNVGIEHADSDANPNNGTTDPITLNIGDNVPNIDASVQDPGTASIGDKLFIDANGNGQQDNGEAGVDGVEVTLTDANGNTQTTTTANGGMYLFDGLDAGDYVVDFDEVEGFDFTTQNNGNDASDSDVNANGTSGTVSLAVGEENLTVDAGLVSEGPDAANDAATTCANEEVTVDVLANDGATASTITQVGGQNIAEGQTVVVGGVEVTLSSGQLVFDGEAAYEALDIGESETATISYTVSDDLGGSSTADVDVTFCGVAETVAEICESLPAQVQYQITDGYGNGNTSAYDILLTSSDARLDGLEIANAFCVSAFDPAAGGENFDVAPLLTGDLYCTVDPFLPDSVLAGQTGLNGQSAADNLDLVNWILNQDFNSAEFAGAGFTDGVTEAEAQAAVWNLTDGTDFIGADFGQLADVQAIVALAEANGEGFEAGAGDIVGLIIDPNPETATNAQPFIIGVEFDQLDCIC